MLHLSNNLKKKKRNINIDLAVLPSHDNTEEIIVLYVECERCREKGYHVEENRGQEVIKDRQR